MVNDQSGLAEKQSLPPAPPLPYEAPQDGALPKRKYTFEVIKDGAMVDNIYLPSDKEFVTLGRLPICDIPMEHPSVSRYHCVIQFRDDGEAYIYDLGSGHGTVLNKQRIQPKSFKKLNVGDQIRFGSSTRTWIFMTDDNEYIEKKEREKEEQLQEYITRKARRSESGNTSEEASAAKGSGSQEDMMDSIHSVTWGFGEDATENAGFLGRLDTDGLNNWERKANAFYYKNPVKSLKTFLEDRGYDVNFEYSETGVGPNYSFIAKVRIPILDNSDMPVFGEGQSSKKKHAEQLAALDACEVLDKCGAFQSNSTAGQKRNRAGGYYDSDDEQDSYYDRSSKPTKNQQKKSEPETFESLTEKLSLVEKTIQELETRLENISDHPTHTKETAKNGADDDLDAYMESLQKDETEKKRKKTLLELSAANKASII
ncbi:hypothetical protein H4219_000608 [Mycoemilia scoparia]|uniref:FHA domain-containing protein n=1 Tax=Mycoemilia scoparia TaxID=417184 RepID=A0A9W8A3B6_9FUNG|nr:hypothetical protein H4219_000608 [Mycoemilia scoparia]